MSKVKTELVIDGKNNTKKAFDEVNKQIQGMNARLEAAGGALKGLLSASFVMGAAKQYANLADQSSQIAARLRLATSSQEEFNKALSEVRRIANENGASVTAVTELYARLSPALREAGRSQTEIVQVTEAVSKALRISGASAAESEGAITQFAQALGAGALRGDEFNSIAEAAPRLMKALADSLGVPVGALRDMAKAGQLTADVVSDALIKELPKLSKEAEEFGETFGSSVQKMENSALQLVGAFDKLTGASARATKSMNEMSVAINGIASGEDTIQNISKLIQEIAKLTPQGAVVFGGGQKVLDEIGLGAKKAVDEVVAAQQTYLLQLEMIEKEEIDRNIRRLAEEERAAAEIAGVKHDELASLRGWAATMGETYEDFIRREKQRHDLRAAAERSGQSMVSEARRGALADLKNSIAAQQKVLEAENKRLAKARQNTLDIEKEFNQLIADVRGGAAGPASYASAQDALISARQAKQAGDNKRAIEEARRAGEIIKQMQADGQNTYGLAGMAEELARIANSAAKLEEVSVEQEVQAVQARLDDLAKQAEALKVISVDVEMDETNVEQVKARMAQLAEELSKVMIIKPTIATPAGGGVSAGTEPQKFATGGYISGPGTGTSDSIPAFLSNGEYVIRAAAVRKLGKNALDLLNRGIPIPRFSDGGMVGRVASLDTAPRNLGSLDISLGGDTFQVFADSSQADQLRIAAKKFGRTQR
ncbi:hypothetical protein D7243_11005 [Stutzerimonas stutzeri]|nr:hypothetical protein [Stutzerimonas stutzeri]